VGGGRRDPGAGIGVEPVPQHRDDAGRAAAQQQREHRVERGVERPGLQQVGVVVDREHGVELAGQLGEVRRFGPRPAR
jgi:hypothetical protein